MYWARENGVDGFMMWSLDTDDYSGSCNEEKYTLHKALKDELDNPTVPPTTTLPPDITESTEQISEANTFPITEISRPGLITKLVQKSRIMPRKRKNKENLQNTNKDRSKKPLKTRKAPIKDPRENSTAIMKQKPRQQGQNLKKKEKELIVQRPIKISGNKSEQPSEKKSSNIATPFKMKSKNVEIKPESKKTKSQVSLLQETTITDKNVTQTNHTIIVTPPSKKKLQKTLNKINRKSTLKPNVKRIVKPRRRNPNRRKGRRRKLTKAQRLRIIQHRRRLMMRRKNMKKPSTAKPNITTMT